MTVPSPGALHAGTSGYSYKQWKGSLFPPDLPQDEFLRAYAAKFSTVEINHTFYRFPVASVLEQWVAETPPGFTFAIKANQRITHRSRLKNVDDVTASFVARCRGIGDRLGPILFQCPPVLRRDDERLTAFLATLPGGPRYAVEFRNKSWFEQPVWDLLARAGVAFVQSDDDDLEAPRAVTANFCYVRLRRESYTTEQLVEWREWIADRRAEGRDVYVYVKHDEGGTSPEPQIRLLGG